MNIKIRTLQRAKVEFIDLSSKSKQKAKIYSFLNIVIKIILAVSGCLITYFSDTNISNDTSMIVIRIFGILVSVTTAISSVFMFEKRSLSNIQIHDKCDSVIQNINEKVEEVRSNEISMDNIEDFIKRIFKELSVLRIATFTDTAFEKIFSERKLGN
jgi:hypothetical protein